MSALLWLAPLVGLLAYWFLVRHKASRVERDWQAFQALRDERQLRTLASVVDIDHETIDFDLRAARVALSMGNSADAVQLLQLSSDIITDLTPDRLRRLKAMAVMIRMAAAVTPVPPVPPGRFKGHALASLAGLGAAMHLLLVTPLERFLLRITVLQVGFKLAVRLLRRAAGGAERHALAVRAWKAFEDGASDWKTLDREHVETARAFLASMRSLPEARASR